MAAERLSFTPSDLSQLSVEMNSLASEYASMMMRLQHLTNRIDHSWQGETMQSLVAEIRHAQQQCSNNLPDLCRCAADLMQQAAHVIRSADANIAASIRLG